MSVVWHDGPLHGLSAGCGPVAWSVPVGTDPGFGADPAELAEAAARRFSPERLSRRLLARALVAKRANYPVAAVRIVTDALGAPRVLEPGGWHVSLAGRGDRSVIAVSPHPIGVDREPLVDGDVLWDMLTADEAATIRSLSLGDRRSAWLVRWTIKEAHAKLIGEPRRIAPEAIETAFGNDERGTAAFEGHSATETRFAHGGIETVAMWRDGMRDATEQTIAKT